MPESVTTVLAWLREQGSALVANLGAIAANHPEPAGRTVICTLATVALIWVLVKIVKKVSK